MRIICATHRQTAVAGGTDRDAPGRLIADISLNVGVDNVLSGSIKLGEGMAEVFPVLCRVHVEKGRAQTLVESPSQGQLPFFTGDQFRDDRSVSRAAHIQCHVWLVLDVNHLQAMFDLLQALGSLVVISVVEILDVKVFHGRPKIGEAPGDSLVMPHDHVRHSGKSHPCHVQAARPKVGLVPEVGHLMAEMHVIRQQRLAGNGVRSRNYPVVRSIDGHRIGQ